MNKDRTDTEEMQQEERIGKTYLVMSLMLTAALVTGTAMTVNAWCIRAGNGLPDTLTAALLTLWAFSYIIYAVLIMRLSRIRKDYLHSGIFCLAYVAAGTVKYLLADCKGLVLGLAPVMEKIDKDWYKLILIVPVIFLLIYMIKLNDCMTSCVAEEDRRMRTALSLFLMLASPAYGFGTLLTPATAVTMLVLLLVPAAATAWLIYLLHVIGKRMTFT